MAEVKMTEVGNLVYSIIGILIGVLVLLVIIPF